MRFTLEKSILKYLRVRLVEQHAETKPGMRGEKNMQKKTGAFAVLRIVVLFIIFLLPLSFMAYADAPAGSDGPRLLMPVHPWRHMPARLKGPATPFPAAAPAPALSTTTWTAIGPAPQSTTVIQSGNSNVSGRITGVAVDPTNPNNIYITAAGGGVWKTTDGGSSWTPVTDSQQTLSMGAIAVAPGNAQKIYAGTGEANNSLDSNYGRGILTSSNGGATWSLSTGPGGIFSNNRYAIAQISVHLTDANTAFAAVASGATNGTSNSGTGIYKTSDGGTTWTNMTMAAGLDAANPWTAVVVDPNSPAIVYAADGFAFGGNSANGVYRSTDSGATWSLLGNAPSGSGTGRIALAVAPSASTVGAHVLYVAMSDPSSFGLHFFGRSDNADAPTPTFTNLTSGTPNFLGGQGWYDIVIGVDPSNSAIVYASGVINHSTQKQLVIQSTNSGATWNDITTIGALTPHTDSHGMALDSKSRMLLGGDGGIYRFDPAGPSWTDINGNLNTIQFYGIGLHPTDSSIAIGGSQDNGTALYSGSLMWTETDGGDAGFAKFSQTNGSRVYHQLPNASFGTNFFRRSDDGGNTWTTKTSGISADVNAQNFTAPFVVDLVNGDHVLYGTDRVWETFDGGDSWTAISGVNTAGFNNGGNHVDAIGLAPSDANTIYASTGGDGFSTSQIFVTTDHGSVWTEMDLGVSGRVKDIQVDPANSLIAYAVISTFNTPNGQVYKTSNGGASWTDITANLPSEPMWSLQIGPTSVPTSACAAAGASSNTLYIGADDGVYVTTNGGTSWSRFGSGLPNGQVFQIELNTNLQILGAGIHGRGLWEIKIGAPGPGATHFSVSAPQSAAAGTAFGITVTALDSSNNTVTGYSGTVHFSSSDTAANLPANSTLTNGTGTFQATLNTAGNQTITATDTVSTSITGTSSAIFVSTIAADFSVSPTSGKAPLTVRFTDKSTGSIKSWLWNFGDGHTSTTRNPSHAYSKAGTYTVSLTVTGKTGGISEITKSNFITVFAAPKANFSAVPTSGKAPLQVNFTDESTGVITSRLWKFGDGTTSTVVSPVHTFSKIGTHAVKLTVTGPGGVSSKTENIRVTK
jgi:PKD repeat protein/photosystem II stability/assembly factor-like uncharacterized protein